MDPINHPPHYTSHPSGVECITITQHHNFCIGSAMKYLWRAGLKEGNPSMQDLEKAKKYIEFEINRLTKPNPTALPLVKEILRQDSDLHGT